LKGMALLASLPGQVPLRPMGDVDFLVRPTDAHAAVDLLASFGWQPHHGTTSFVKHAVIPRLAGYEFSDGSRRYLDLHWYFLQECRWPDADEELWSRLIPVQWGGQVCHTPSFEDQVLHACVHGTRWSGPIGALRWATDCTLILRAQHANFDWSYLLE